MLVSIIIPCYNEESVLNIFWAALKEECNKHIEFLYQFIFIDDGSSDNTLSILKNIKKDSSDISIIEFSRNFGKEAALLAGLRAVRGDVAIPIDADLQHPPKVMFDMLTKYVESHVDMVIAIRNNRDNESWLYKRLTSLYYKIENITSEYPIPQDAGDFRLMSKDIVKVISNIPEKLLYMKGLYAWCGFRSATITYDVAKREAGKTKFTPLKLISLAGTGILNSSTMPLKILFILGTLIFGIASIFSIWVLCKTIILGVDVPGYASIIIFSALLGGIQLLAIGIIGEYIGRIFQEVKGRPAYIIKKKF